ncbi:MAG: inositol monophosphatase [Anaerolineae bacterium]|nr:inositol monophosphatase [Anaerolineae bacterium]
MPDWNALRPEVEAVALRAGEETLRYFRKPLAQWTKAGPFDVVTEADKASEAVILPALRALLPEAALLSEESGASGDEGGLRWVVDPIDGTANFAAGMPYYSISIALADVAGQPVIGVVHNPAYGELFSAALGGGAALNGEPIHVSATPALAQSILLGGFSIYPELAKPQLRQWMALMQRTRGLRRMGSAALDLASVAAGRADGYWESSLSPWDVLAGLLLVQEAGGRISDFAARPDKLYSAKEMAVTNGAIHDELLAALAAAGDQGGL